MEFKIFKNENSKILKEYWLTQSEWDALDKTTVQEGDIYHIVGTIDKGDLSADINASLAKGDSSLQKPTATLAKESFVKVGIDGTQKFDESSYAALDADKTNTFYSANTFNRPVKLAKDTSYVEYGEQSSYKFRDNSKENAVATLNDLIEDDTKTYILFNGPEFPVQTQYISSNFTVNAGTTIDWGDGSIQSFSSETNNVSHVYASEGLYKIVISGLKSIVNGAFMGAGVKYVKFGRTVTNVGNSAFQGTGVSSVIIPKTITQMGTSVFFYSKLETVRVLSETPLSVQSDIFEHSPIEKIIVPKSAINAYKSAPGWSTYADKIVYEVDSSDLTGGGSSVTIVQGLGDSTTAVMSQKAVTNIYDELKYTPNATKILYNGDFSKTLPTAISCRFYWGDGTFTDYTNAVEFSHTYSGQPTLHTISIVGLTSIPDSMFTDDTELYEITLGVGADMICFANCPNLKTIRIQDNDENVLPITVSNESVVFTYDFDYVNFRIVVPRRLYVKILENNTNISTEFIWNFVVPDDSYVCSHSIQLSGSNNSTYEVMLYSTCKLPLNQVPLATNPSTGTDQKRDLLRELIDGEIAYKYSGDSMDGFGSLIYSDSDNQYHLALCGGFGATKTDETFDLTEIISDIVKLK